MENEKLTLDERRELGLRQQAENLGFGHCGRCGMTWNYVQHHSTDYGNGDGLFPLCVECWTELGTGEKRLPFYEQLFQEWTRQRNLSRGKWEISETEWNDKWKKIEKAVLEEEEYFHAGYILIGENEFLGVYRDDFYRFLYKENGEYFLFGEDFDSSRIMPHKRDAHTFKGYSIPVENYK